MDCNKEIKEIKNIISSALLMDIIKKEASNIISNKVIVTSGELFDQPEYDIVIKHKSGKEESDKIGRRLKSHVKNININNIVDNMVGIKINKGIKNARNDKKNS